MKIAKLVITAALLGALAGCGQIDDARRAGQEAVRAASEVQGTAAALAPTLQAAAPTLQALAPTLQALAPTIQAYAPTLEALAPTIQAAAPGVRQTVEALATQQPAARATVEALTGGAGAPPDIPLPRSRKAATMTRTSVSYITDAPYDSILSLYQTRMPDLGWTQQDSSAADGGATLRFVKGGRVATVTIAALAQGTAVSIAIEE